MISKKELNKKIKEKGHITMPHSHLKFYPMKIGQWNSVGVVLVTLNGTNRVIDLKYLLRNAT